MNSLLTPQVLKESMTSQQKRGGVFLSLVKNVLTLETQKEGPSLVIVFEGVLSSFAAKEAVTKELQDNWIFIFKNKTDWETALNF